MVHKVSTIFEASIVPLSLTTYIPEILISTRAINKGLEKLKPYLVGTNIHNKGKVVLGTVEGDIHHIVKNLVWMMLEAMGLM